MRVACSPHYVQLCYHHKLHYKVSTTDTAARLFCDSLASSLFLIRLYFSIGLGQHSLPTNYTVVVAMDKAAAADDVIMMITAYAYALQAHSPAGVRVWRRTGSIQTSLKYYVSIRCLQIYSTAHMARFSSPFPGRLRLPQPFRGWQPAPGRVPAWQKRDVRSGDAGPQPATQQRASTLFT